MNFLVVLTVTLASKCWAIPTASEKKLTDNLNQILRPVDFELAEALRSLDLATHALKDDPTYMNLEKMLKDSLKNFKSEQKTPKIQEHIQVFHPDFEEIEYDTSRIILKKPNRVHKRMIPTDNMFEHNHEPLIFPDQTVNYNEQQKESLVAQQQNYLAIQQQEQERNMQQELQREEKMKSEDNPLVRNPATQNCEFKCENKKFSVCAVNSLNKFSIFDNECDMKMNNCLNPGIEWQALSVQTCKNTLQGFYKKLDKFFTQYAD